MSNVQLSAERSDHDLSHFSFSCGAIGRLKTISHTMVQAGDSIDIEAIGALRLSPLRRGLAIDSQVDIFTFYQPHRRSLGDSWVELVKAGSGSGLAIQGLYIGESDWDGGSLGIRLPSHGFGPRALANTYVQVYNNYFKNPHDADIPTDVHWTELFDQESRINGLTCANLKTIWSAPLPDAVQATSAFNPSPDGTIDLMSLNAAHGALHTKQERELFGARYRDLMENMGGHTSFDGDGRPQLLMRSKIWASGYDVDGTDAQSMGQFSGRVQQVVEHKVPRFYCPEHGTIITLMVVRFPPIHPDAIPYHVGASTWTYDEVVGDPAVDGNRPIVSVPMDNLFRGGSAGNSIKLPWGQWHRAVPHYVDPVMSNIEGFPFLSHIPRNEYECVMVDSATYNECFQSLALAHWNTQLRVNVNVLRALPSAIQSAMVNV